MSNLDVKPGNEADRAQVRVMGARQVWTVVLLFAGYAAYYFCRSDLSVAMPLLIDDLG